MDVLLKDLSYRKVFMNSSSSTLYDIYEKWIKESELNTLNGCVNFRNTFAKDYPLILKEIESIKNELNLLKEHSYKDLEVICGHFKKLEIELPTIDYLKSHETAIILLENLKLCDIEYYNFLSKKLLINEAFRTFIHQANACITTANPALFERTLYEDRKILKALEKDNFFKSKIEVYKDQIGRFYTILNNLTCDFISHEIFDMEMFESFALYDYIYLVEDHSHNFIFNGNTYTIEVVTDLDDAFNIVSNKYKIIEIIEVLINNAREELCISKQKSKILTISIKKHEDYFTVSIQDNGRGIENTEEIFKKNFTTKSGFGGSGIGLAVAKEIIESLNGYIHVETSKNGSKFILELPLG